MPKFNMLMNSLFAADEGDVEKTPEEIAAAAAALAAEAEGASTDGEPKSYDEAYVKGLRDEAAQARIARNKEKEDREALAAKLQAYEDAKLSDAEKLTKAFDDAKQRADKNEFLAQDLQVKFQLALAAADPANQIADVNAAIKLIDRDTLEFDDSGSITNLQTALETLKTTYPSVVAVAGKAPAPNTGATNPAKNGASKVYTQSDLKKLSPEKISELHAAGELNNLLGIK